MFKSQSKLGEVLARMSERLTAEEMTSVDESFAAGKWLIRVTTNGQRQGAEINCIVAELGDAAGDLFDKLSKCRRP